MSLKKEFQIFFYCANSRNTKVLDQNFCHIGAEECRESGTEMDILHAKIQKRQQNDDSLLLIPRNVVGDGQVVDIVQTENFLELQSNDSQRIRIVALPGVQNTRNAVDVAQRQFVVFVFRASGCCCGILKL